MILVDSSVWIDLLRNQTTPETARLEHLLGSEQIAIGDLMLVEVLQGIPAEHHFEAARHMFSRLECVTIGGSNVAVTAAANYRQLRAIGITPRKTIDTLIATRCIIDGHALLFSDRDFDPFVKHLGLVSAMG